MSRASWDLACIPAAAATIFCWFSSLAFSCSTVGGGAGARLLNGCHCLSLNSVGKYWYFHNWFIVTVHEQMNSFEKRYKYHANSKKSFETTADKTIRAFVSAATHLN